MGRFSARFLITAGAIILACAAVFLLIATIQEALRGQPSALEDARAAAWTIATLLIVLAAFAAWVLGGYLLEPLRNLRRDVTLNARSRAIAEPYAGETEEIGALRETLVRVLRELEEEAHEARTQAHQIWTLVEEVDGGIMQVGDDGRFIHVNRAARAMLSLPSQPEGQQVATLIRSHELRNIIEQAAVGHAVAPTEITVDHRQLLVASQHVARPEEGGGALISVADLTELRRAENVRREFVANVSHELKTPLTAIRGYTETLISDELPREEQLQFLDVIRRNAERLQRTVEELLDLSRLQSGGWVPQPADVDVAESARQVWSNCEPASKRSSVEFAVTGGPAQVHVDPQGFEQVLSNIFDNALRYTPEGGRIEARISDKGERVVVEISDTGAGIPAASLPRVFERFYRVDPSRSRAEGGTGLGLAIVKHLVERMSGSVSATSVLGSGTTIRLELPRSSSHD